MKSFKTIALAAALLAVAAPATAQDTGSADLSMYVALGDSLTAGFASGGLVNVYQQGSYPAVIAAQAGAADFQQPLISRPGIPPVLVLENLAPTLVPAGTAPGVPTNPELPRPYNNLGVPGSNVVDLVTTTGDIQNLLAGNLDNVMHDVILRNGVNTALEQAIGLQPSFVTVWIGNNDILGAAINGTPIDGITMTPLTVFEQMYTTALGALAQNTTADVVVANIPSVTSIPFVTTIDPFLTAPDGTHIPLIGSNGPLPEDAYVTLGAAGLLRQGIGIPVAAGGTGQPLPEDLQVIGGQVVPGVVLRSEEVQAIETRVGELNAVIDAVAAATGARVFDVNGLFQDVAAHGYEVGGGLELGTDFLTGGIFSYDGVHPQTLGYAVVAQEMIEFINAEFGASIPAVNLYGMLTSAPVDPVPSSAANSPASVFGPEAFDALRTAFPLVGDPSPRSESRLEDGAERLPTAAERRVIAPR